MAVQKRDMMSGLGKGIRVLETFQPGRVRQTVSDAAAASGLDRATARRCLLTLADLGYADYDGKYFTLTPQVLRLGTSCLASMPLPHIVQPLLDRLSDELRESSSVCILDGTEIVYIARAAQRKVMSVALMPGSRLPAYCTSMGRVLLAALPETQARQIIRSSTRTKLTPWTIISEGAIMDILSSVRSNGYAINDQEIELGLRSLAIPVINARGTVVASMNVGVAAIQPSVDDLLDKFLTPMLLVQSRLKRLLI